jgi:hypothetical protein
MIWFNSLTLKARVEPRSKFKIKKRHNQNKMIKIKKISLMSSKERKETLQREL